MAYAALITVDNSGEEPEAGRRGLREELTPAMRALPGFQSCLFLTAYERGAGLGVVVFETLEQAAGLANSIKVGTNIHPGVTAVPAASQEPCPSAPSNGKRPATCAVPSIGCSQPGPSRRADAPVRTKTCDKKEGCA